MQTVRKSAALATAIAAVAISALAPAPSDAAQILGGDVLVLRVGDGSATEGSGSRSATVWVDDFRLTGGTWGLFQSIAIPSSGVDALTLNQNATTEGTINMSLDGNYLVFAGYRRDAQTGSPGALPAATAPRVIGRVALDGTVDTSTVLTTNIVNSPDLYDKSSVRGVASTDGQHFWVTGTDGNATPISGVTYTPGLGAVNSVILTNTNTRGVGIYGGNLYVDSQTTLRRITVAGGGLPTSTPVTNGPSFITGLANSQNAVAFDLDPAVPGIDTVYVGDATNSKVLKYSLTNAANPDATGSWTLSGSVTVDTAAFNLTGFQTHGGVVIYYTNTAANATTTPSYLASFTDTAGYNAAPTGTGVRLAQSTANTSFRGVAIVPSAGDVNGDFLLSADDYIALDKFVAANGIGAANASRLNGDLNGDGKVDPLDYLAIDTAWGKAHGPLSPSFLADRESQFGPNYVASLTAAVPEPTSLAACGLALLPLATRRRRT